MLDEAGDDYERQYMQPGERLLYREKVVSRSSFALSLVFGVVFGVPGLAVIAAAALGAIPGPVAIAGVASAAFAAFMVIAGAAFSVSRAMVTGGHLHVHFGWAKRKIPIEAIDEVKLVTLQGIKRGKVSVGLDGVVRTWVGNSQGGRGVEVHYREGARKHVLTIGSETPERFVEALGSTRAGAATPVRVAAGAAVDAAAQAEAEAIATEAEAEARRATRR